MLHGGPYCVFGRPFMLQIMPQCFEFDDDVSTMRFALNCGDFLWLLESKSFDEDILGDQEANFYG